MVTRKSEAQANAEAMARRSASYADEHARSWEVRFDRPSHEPRNLREVVHDLRRAYAEEVPIRIHSRDTDEGGDPAWSPEFMRWMTGSDFATDDADEGVTEVYLTPFRACIAAMTRSPDEGTRRRASIAINVVIGGLGPVESAMIEGVPDWCARDVASRSLGIVWRRLCDVRLDLHREHAAA